MANDYFQNDTAFVRHTLSRAEALNQALQGVEAGFDKLPGADVLSQGRVTYAADTGAADAYAVALSKAPSAYTAGLNVVMKAANANTGASTINVNSLGVKPIKRYDGSALLANDIAVGSIISLVYDGTNFLLTGVHGGEVQLAKDWANKTSAAVSGSEYSAKKWATETGVVSGGLKGARGYASDASGSASAASSSASAAATSETNTATIYDNFDDRYLGAKASDPSTDNDGDPLVDGAIYFNTTSNKMRVYSTSSSSFSDVAPTATSVTVSQISDRPDGFLLTETGITASTTQTQAGATALTKQYNVVGTVANESDSLKLISAAAANSQTIRNEGNNAAQIFPASGDAIDGGTVDAADPNLLPAGASRTYFAADGTNWYTATTVQGESPGYFDTTASGSISEGDVVSILNDGKVQSVIQKNTSSGAAAIFESAGIAYTSCVQITTDKALFAYQDKGNSNYGTAVVVTASGGTLSFGTPVVFETGEAEFPDIALIAADKVVIVYTDAGNASYGTAVVGTISGTSISFGTPEVFNFGAASRRCSVAKLDTDKVIIGYQDGGASNRGSATVATISGTNFTFGTEAAYYTGVADHTTITQLTTDKALIVYQDVTNSWRGSAVVATVSGTTPSFGTTGSFNNNTAAYDLSSDLLVTDKVVVAYRDQGNSNYGTVIIVSVSGTSVSFGDEFVFESAGIYNPSVAEVDTNTFIVAYRDSGNSSYGTACTGVLSSNEISFLGFSPIVFESAQVLYPAVCKLDTGKGVCGYDDGGNTDYGTAVVLNSADTNASDWIGISQSAAADAGAVTIATLGAIDGNQTGLVPGTYYYTDDGGAITSTSNANKVGRALTTTDILITGDAQ